MPSPRKNSLFPPIEDDGIFLQNLAGMNEQFHPMDDSWDDFEDLFQLMDVPYHLSELPCKSEVDKRK